MTRRKVMFSLMGSSVLYPCYLEPRWLALTRPEAKLFRGSLDRPIRLLHISDLHYSFFVPLGLIESAVSRGLDEKPDLICVTGDFITHGEDVSSGA